MRDQLIMDSRDRGLGDDRISQLPDPILHCIFSFLTTRDLVRSSVLSRRWRNLWASMQSLFFDEIEFDYTEEFACFVDAVLLLRDPLDVHTFRLLWNDGYNKIRANMWITYAVKHNVRVLDLMIDTFLGNIELPHCLLTCQSLEVLCISLNNCAEISQLRFAGFSQIKRLNFFHINIRHAVLEQLISGCPVIEDLCLEFCWIMDSKVTHLHISSQTMKTLRIVGCYIRDGLIRISIPTLTSLHYEASTIVGASLENLSSLVYAFISDVDEDRSKRQSNVLEFIRGLSIAKVLNLFGPWLELVTGKEPSESLTFQNLENLTMGRWCMTHCFQPVAYFLQHSPNLEQLNLKDPILPSSCSYGLETGWKSDNLSFDCLHLKRIEICCFEMNERIQELVKTLLENSRVLDRIKII